MRALMISGLIAALVAVTCQPSTMATDVDDLAYRLKRVATEGTTDERNAAIQELETLAKKYRRLAEEAPDAVSEYGTNLTKPDTIRCNRILQVLAQIGDKCSLPLFEGMMSSTEEQLRYTGMVGYVMIAGAVDALPFVERIASLKLYKRLVPLQQLISLTRKARLSAEDKRKVHTFMLENIQMEGVTKLMDEALCEQLPGYRTSVQRAEAIESLAESTNKHTQLYVQWAWEDLEKTPDDQRKDFRAKGGLLDPAVMADWRTLKPAPPAGLKPKGAEAFREALWAGTVKRQALRDFAKECGVSEKDMIAEMMNLARQDRQEAEDPPPLVWPFNSCTRLKAEGNWCCRQLAALAAFRDKGTLPFFEEMATSTDEYIRFYALYSYLKVIGAIEVLPPPYSGYPEREDYEECFMGWPPTLEEMLTVTDVTFAPPPALSSAEKRKAYTLMLEKVQTEGERSIVRVLDEVLRRDVPGYATSVQRMEVAERLSASDKIGLFGERISDHWKPVKDEVAKTPNDKRRDFRAKGDLLDPERKH